MTARLVWLLLLFFPPLSGETWRQEREEGFSVELRASPSSLNLTQWLEVDLLLKHPKGYAPNWDELRENLLERQSKKPWGFTLTTEKIDPPEERDGGVVEQAHYQLEPWSAGEHFLSFYNITFYGKSSSQEPVDFFAPLLKITVSAPATLPHLDSLAEGPLPLNSTLRPTLTAENRRRFLQEPMDSDQGPLDNPLSLFEQALSWTSLGILILLTLIALIGYRVWRRPWSDGTASKAHDPRLKALEALQRLMQEGLPERGDYGRFFVELTAIVRRFIEESYRIRAPEQTTEEFLQELTDHSFFDEDTRGRLKEFLTSADMVKFARLPASLQQAQEAGQAAKRFVESSWNRSSHQE